MIIRILLFTCIETPINLAFNDDTSYTTVIIWAVVEIFVIFYFNSLKIDACFLGDMIVRFFSAYYDSDY